MIYIINNFHVFNSLHNILNQHVKFNILK